MLKICTFLKKKLTLFLDGILDMLKIGNLPINPLYPLARQLAGTPPGRGRNSFI